MPDFQMMITDAGRALLANNVAHSNTASIDRIEVGQGNRTPDGTETALVSPYYPARQVANPAGSASGPSFQFEYLDTATGAGAGYDVNEVGAFSGGTLVFYGSQAAGTIITKPSNGALRTTFVGAYLAGDLDSFTFNATLAVAAATETVQGIIEIADNDESDASEGSALDDKAVSPKKWWRMFTGARIVARIAALSGANRLSYNSLKDTPNIPSQPSLAGFAMLASPTFTGTPRAPTPPDNDNSTRIATTAWGLSITEGFRRIISATLFDTSFPASPATGQNVFFHEAVGSGLSWRDTDGTTVLTSAQAGDWAQWNGSFWQKQETRTTDLFTIPE